MVLFFFDIYCSSDPVISGENVDLNMTSPFKVGFFKSEILPSMTDFLPYDTRILL
jgi:hypothetical protein